MWLLDVMFNSFWLFQKLLQAVTKFEKVMCMYVHIHSYIQNTYTYNLYIIHTHYITIGCSWSNSYKTLGLWLWFGYFLEDECYLCTCIYTHLHLLLGFQNFLKNVTYVITVVLWIVTSSIISIKPNIVLMTYVDFLTEILEP